VIHLHPLAVAAYVNAKNGRSQIEKLFAREAKPPLWVPYTDPGYMLAKKIARLVADYEKEHGCRPRILFLEKHGLFVTGSSANAALRLVRHVIKLCESSLKPPKTPRTRLPSAESVTTAKLMIRKSIFDATGQYVPVSYFPALEAVPAFMAHKDAQKLLATPALNPDELVYANGSALWVDKLKTAAVTRRIHALVSRGQKVPAAFVVKGLGLFVAADKALAGLIAEIAETSLKIRMHAARFGGVLALSKREQNFVKKPSARSSSAVPVEASWRIASPS